MSDGSELSRIYTSLCAERVEHLSYGLGSQGRQFL